MSFNKEASIRYSIIDACISNKQRPYPSMENLIEACERKLGKQFSVSAIQKDIKAMKEDEQLAYLAPIKFSKSHNGYYYTEQDYTIRKIALHDSHIEALKAAADVLSMFSGSRVNENFNAAVDKIFAAIHEQFPGGDKKRKVIQTESTPNHKGFEHFELLLHAAKECIPVCLVHYSYKHRDFKSIIIHPYILKEFHNNWYLVGYSEHHKELRTFGLDRIYEPKLLRHKFIKPKENQVEMYFEHLFGVYPFTEQKLQEIEFLVNPMLSDYLNAHPLHSSQVRKEEKNYGHALFTLKLIPSQELLNFFITYSNQLVVKKPLWIQKQINDYHQQALEYHELISSREKGK